MRRALPFFFIPQFQLSWKSIGIIPIYSRDYFAHGLLGNCLPPKNGYFCQAHHPVKIEKGSDGKPKLQFTEDEFLSKFPKGAKLDDVLTLTVYLGEKPWDAPLTYFESLNMSEDAKKYKSDIRFYFIDPREIDEADFEGFETEIGDVYRFLKYRDEQFVDSLDDFLQTHIGMTLSEKGAKLLLACGVEANITKPTYTVKGGRVLMCDSMRALIEKKNREHDVNHIIRSVDVLGWTESQAMDFYEIPEEERPKYAALIAAARAAQTSAATAAS